MFFYFSIDAQTVHLKPAGIKQDDGKSGATWKKAEAEVLKYK